MLHVYMHIPFLVTDTPEIAAPVVLAIVVLLLSGGIVAAVVVVYFKRRKATINLESLQFTLTSPTNNGPTNIEEKPVKVISVCTYKLGQSKVVWGLVSMCWFRN